MSFPRRMLGSLVLIALFLGRVESAPPLPIDLVPADACIGIAIRNLEDLKSRSDKLLKDRHDIPRFSQLFEMAFNELKLGWPVDEKAATSILCTTGKLGGFAADADPNNQFTIGTIIPFGQLADVTKAWKVKAEDVKGGQVVEVPGKVFERRFGLSYLGVRDKHAYLAGSKAAVEAWLQAKTLRQTLPADRHKRLDASDGLFYLGPPLLAVARKNIDTDWAPNNLSVREQEAHKRIARAMTEARHVLASYRLDEGIGLDINVAFDPAGKESQALLKEFNAGKQTSSLAGLPVGGPVFGAYASAGGASDNLDLARVVTTEFWLGWRNGPFLLESDAPVIRSILGRLYGKVKSSRAALYSTAEKTKVGPLALVAIFEPKDTAALVKEVRQMARLADVKAFEPKGEAAQAEIVRLVKDLGADEFDARESASTQLALIGEPALQALAKAEQSDDAEVRRRAGELRTAIEQVAKLRKEELAKGLFKQSFHPQFSFKEKAEERGGAPVHHLGLAFEADDAPFAVWLKDLFGPDWNRLRLAVVGDRVVVLVGSDVGLLDQAIANVRDGKAGLEQSPALAGFQKQVGPDRRVELHVALRMVRQLTTPADKLPKDFKPSATLSSAALRTGPADMSLDFWVPADAIEDGLFWVR